MTSLIWMGSLLIMVGVVSGAPDFRSILIERACLKRPELEFCGPSTSAEPVARSVEPLVLPPMPATLPVTTTTTTTSTTTTTEAPKSSSASVSSPLLDDDSVDFENSTASLESEKLGSLVKLPKPVKSSTEAVVDQVIERSGVATSDTPPSNSTVPTVKIEDEKGVLVFVSEYCVVERERFVRGCHGDINKKEEDFCKTYVAACASTTGVLPVMTYCARYYTYYPTHCKTQLVDPKALQFCFAFEQFCLPEKAAAGDGKSSSQKPKSNLRRCEDVLPEARKVCNPFPDPKDTFNLLRCTHFFTTCKKYVDWL